jgi:hypothetical protein
MRSVLHGLSGLTIDIPITATSSMPATLKVVYTFPLGGSPVTLSTTGIDPAATVAYLEIHPIM